MGPMLLMMGVSAAMDVLNTPIDASGGAFWREAANDERIAAQKDQTKAMQEVNEAGQKKADQEMKISQLNNDMQQDYASSAWGKTLAAKAESQYVPKLDQIATDEYNKATSVAKQLDTKATSDLKAAATDEYNASLDDESILERIF